MTKHLSSSEIVFESIVAAPSDVIAIDLVRLDAMDRLWIGNELMMNTQSLQKLFEILNFIKKNMMEVQELNPIRFGADNWVEGT